MKITYEELMDIIETERRDELMCAKSFKRLMKKTFNPFRKLGCYLTAKRCIDHVVGMDLVIRKIKNAMEEP
jgi:hypothetical protein